MRYIDTNIILRFLTEDKTSIPNLVNFFNKLKIGEVEVRCLDIVFFQTIFVLKSFYKVGKEEIIPVMKTLLAFKGLKFKDGKILERTLELWERHPDDIIDCYIVSNMEKEGEKEIYSFDRKIEGLGVKIAHLD